MKLPEFTITTGHNLNCEARFTPVAERAGEACRDMGGACCSCYDKWAKARRTAVILMLKTPCAGPKIRNTKIIDILYSYFGLVLGFIDADLCK